MTGIKGVGFPSLREREWGTAKGLYSQMNKSGIISCVATVISVFIGPTIACRSDRDSQAESIICIERLHELEKDQLRGTAALYSGWTLDDMVEITMLYGDTDKPCPMDVSKPATLAKYRVAGSDGKIHFGWRLQP